MNPSSAETVQQLVGLLQSASSIVVFTGAGISTESGIADYRSKGGLWDRFRPVTLQEFLASEEKRREYWQYKKELYHSMAQAEPNAGHAAIAKLDRTGKLTGVITQNIDGLHQMAGLRNEKILELHGTNRKTICLDCGEITSWEETYRRLCSGEEIPRCASCGGLLKPATVSFGQSLDSRVLNQAYQWAEQCDLLLTVGSTLIVEPAASIPRLAKGNGSRLVILNLSETPLDDRADLIIRGKAGPILKEAVDRLLETSGHPI